MCLSRMRCQYHSVEFLSEGFSLWVVEAISTKALLYIDHFYHQMNSTKCLLEVDDTGGLMFKL